MDHLLQRLLRQAHLFDDPAAYEAGVLDALEAVQADGAAPDADAVATSKRQHPASAVRRDLRPVEGSVA
ncbi:MAG: hypothetical protein EA388_10075 [Nitriliruptor sp.]|nr:MAG: hypothetical protein EA388_10075 [Nitriliruptor sp.]